MQTAVLENGFAVEAGEIVVFNFDSQTRAYLSQSTEYLPVGVSIPANACTDKPLKAKSGYVVCRNSKLTGWEYQADHRGETVWNNHYHPQGRRQPPFRAGRSWSLYGRDCQLAA